MPTYEYQCKECGLRFERFQSIKDEPIRKCPTCGSPVKKLISAGAGVIFKGSGFYITDHRDESYKQAEKREKEPDLDTKNTKSDLDTKSAKSETKQGNNNS